MSITVKIDSSGRVMIPAQVRKELHLEDGMLLQLDHKAGTITLISREQAVRKAQELFMSKSPERVLSVEVLADRKLEAERER
jgi:AbrB family looped-hinge helix DNA binding protein